MPTFAELNLDRGLIKSLQDVATLDAASLSALVMPTSNSVASGNTATDVNQGTVIIRADHIDTGAINLAQGFLTSQLSSIPLPTDGLRIDFNGIFGRKAGVTTFSITSGGDATFSGNVLGGSLDIPDTVSNNSFHVDTSGNAWWGSPSLSTAQIKIVAAGTMTVNYGSNIELLQGGIIKFTSVAAPTACTAALIPGAGDVTHGTHKYKVTFVTPTGETNLGSVSNTVIVNNATFGEKVALTNIPVSTSGAVTSRRVYRTKFTSGSLFYLLVEINDNITTTYTDNVADVNLGSNEMSLAANDTFGKLTVDGLESLSLSSVNVFVGQNSGVSITAGYYNVGAGVDSLRVNTSGYNNVAVGYRSLYSNTIGESNTGCGYGTLYDNVDGFKNVAVGFVALESNTQGQENVAVGYAASDSNTEGNYNTSIGSLALRYTTTGDSNTAVGNGAIYTNDSGDKNTAIGKYALFSTLGSNNVAIGYNAGSYETGSNSFYVDNQDRTNTAGDKAKALLYGVFDATAASQTLQANAALKALEIRSLSDLGGEASSNSLTNVSNVAANSTGIGTILFKGATSRDSAGFIKIYIGTTAYYVPVFSAITG